MVTMSTSLLLTLTPGDDCIVYMYSIKVLDTLAITLFHLLSWIVVYQIILYIVRKTGAQVRVTLPIAIIEYQPYQYWS